VSDPGNDKKGNFWTTLPGILTGLAALITAIAGLLTVILHLSSQKLPDSSTAPSPIHTPEATQPPTSVTGNWEWEGVGSATLEQNGNEVTGLLRYYKPSGLTASLQGTFNERELTFVWWFTQGPSSLQNPQGDGTLTWGTDGRTLRTYPKT